MKRILILAPWPCRFPRHGGQIRCAAEIASYRRAGFDVAVSSFYDPNNTPPDHVTADDIPITEGIYSLLASGRYDTGRSIIELWRAVADANDSYNLFKALVIKASPDILQFEEPFLWPVIRRLRNEGVLRGVKIIHSSYNFETHAWRDLGVAGQAVSPDTLKDIGRLEREIAVSCDLIVTVSMSDAEEFKKLGARTVRCAGNGTNTSIPFEPSQALNRYVSRDCSYAFFVSSAHPPNAYGLMSMTAGLDEPLPCHGELFVAGTICSTLQSSPNFLRNRNLFDNTRFLGWVEQELLNGLYGQAKVVILPNTLGGGTNLKTPEALVTGRPIVATTLAFRGFEPYMALEHVRIKDDPEEFWHEVNQYLYDDFVVAGRPEQVIRGLSWDESLKPFVDAVNELF